jgi:Rod binding domain-containing protein
MDALGALIAAGVAPPRSGGRPGTPAVAADNAEAARQMESLFAFEMVKAMRRTVPESGLLSGGRGEEVMRSVQDQALAEAIAARGGLGLAASLQRSLDRINPTGVAPTGVAPTGAAPSGVASTDAPADAPTPANGPGQGR